MTEVEREEDQQSTAALGQLHLSLKQSEQINVYGSEELLQSLSQHKTLQKNKQKKAIHNIKYRIKML